MQLLVAGHEHLAQAAPGVGPQDAKPRAGGGRCARGAGGTRRSGRTRPMSPRGLGALFWPAGSGDAEQAGLQLRVGNPFQVRADRTE